MRLTILASAAALSCLAVVVASARGADKPAAVEVPDKIMAALKGRFPEPQVKSCEKEEEGGKTVYDVELTSKGRKFEADILADGTIIEIEKEVVAKDFPAACSKAVAEKFPKAKVKEIMEVNKVEGKKETPIHYEVVLEEPGKKAFEAVVALDGSSVKEEKEEAAGK